MLLYSRTECYKIQIHLLLPHLVVRDGHQLEVALLGPAADDLRQRLCQSHLLERHEQKQNQAQAELTCFSKSLQEQNSNMNYPQVRLLVTIYKRTTARTCDRRTSSTRLFRGLVLLF